jgi:hypothetical protein
MTLLYDGEPGGLLTFLERLIIQADLSNWKKIMTPDSSGVLQTLLTEHGRLTMANICTYSETYSGHRGHKEQNSAQMHACLAQSLTELVVSKVKSQLVVFQIQIKWTMGHVTSSLSSKAALLRAGQLLQPFEMLWAAYQPTWQKWVVTSGNLTTTFRNNATPCYKEVRNLKTS